MEIRAVNQQDNMSLIKELQVQQLLIGDYRGGRVRGLDPRKMNKVYDRVCILHMELVARGIIRETPKKILNGKLNSDIINRKTIAYPTRKKLGKKKKGGRRRR